MAIRRRSVVAALTSPPIGVAVAYVFMVLLLDLTEDVPLRGLVQLFVNFMTIGSVVAYAVEAVIGIPISVLLRRRNRLTVLATVGVGAVCGVIALLPVLRVMVGSVSGAAGTLLVGAVSGTCAGAWFWIIALRHGAPPREDEASPVEVETEPTAP